MEVVYAFMSRNVSVCRFLKIVSMFREGDAVMGAGSMGGK